MNYIDVEKVIIDNKEIMTELLFCLICQGIVINPKECSKCQRPFCVRCVNLLENKECAVCKNAEFKPTSTNQT